MGIWYMGIVIAFALAGWLGRCGKVR